MINTENDFYGRQDGERILYVVKPHPFAVFIRSIQIYLVAFVVFFVFAMLGSVFSSLSSLFTLIGVILGLVIVFLGGRIMRDYQKRNISYITDRRIVHFEPTTLFATNSRTLSWDEVVKVKTFPKNFIWKQMAIGNVVVNARTPGRPDGSDHEVIVDDIELKDVFYYRDLGNYIDKILFTYKQRPKEIDLIKPFVAKPRGQRD